VTTIKSKATFPALTTVAIYSLWTIPLSAQVQQAWVARYIGPTNSTAAAVAMALDGLGNVYVAGSLSWTNGASDYLTVKYDPNGTKLWAQSYDGPSNAVDVVAALAIGSTGEVYVSGTSGNTKP
jgi:hypothetical protein